MNKRKVLNIINNQRILIALVFLILLLSLLSDTFFSYENLINILMQISIEGIVAIGITVLMLMGEIDLSVGFNMALVGTVIILLENSGAGLLIAIVCGIVTGTFVGLVNGLIVTRLKLPSLPVTLGMMIALQGVVLWLTNTETVKGLDERFIILGNGSFYTIPFAVIIFIVILLIFFVIIGRTVYGRNIYAIGGNQTASRFFGINVEKTKLISFIIMGFLVGIAGLILTSRLNIASAVLGRDTPIFVITAVLLGGTSLWGGEGGIVNTFKGILLLGVIANGLRMAQIPVTWHILIKGLLLIFIVSIDGLYVRRAKFR